jgi:hypothetical protein
MINPAGGAIRRRYRAAANHLAAGLSAAPMAAEGGYADQPHLHRDVQSFTGATPSAVAGAPWSSWVTLIRRRIPCQLVGLASPCSKMALLNRAVWARCLAASSIGPEMSRPSESQPAPRAAAMARLTAPLPGRTAPLRPITTTAFTLNPLIEPVCEGGVPTDQDRQSLRSFPGLSEDMALERALKLLGAPERIGALPRLSRRRRFRGAGER